VTPEAIDRQNASTRDYWQMPATIIDKMGIVAGMRVIDLGAGSGYLLPHLSRAVGPSGLVYAVEVQPELIKLLEKRVRKENLGNVRVVRSTASDLPLSDLVDRVLLLNTYAELEDPIGMMKALRLRLRPTGQMAVIDYPPYDDIPGSPLDDRLSTDTVVAEARGAGFIEHARYRVLPRQYFVAFINEEEVAEGDGDEDAAPEAGAVTPVDDASGLQERGS
jgi:ubiquinone/menaquinone biosynthesis C-methylase UbiE